MFYNIKKAYLCSQKEENQPNYKVLIMLTAKIGENAGLVWNALQGGALTTEALKKATKLKVADLNLALGWLAREGKISFEISEKETIISLL